MSNVRDFRSQRFDTNKIFTVSMKHKQAWKQGKINYIYARHYVTIAVDPLIGQLEIWIIKKHQRFPKALNSSNLTYLNVYIIITPGTGKLYTQQHHIQLIGHGVECLFTTFYLGKLDAPAHQSPSQQSQQTNGSHFTHNTVQSTITWL